MNASSWRQATAILVRLAQEQKDREMIRNAGVGKSLLALAVSEAFEPLNWFFGSPKTLASAVKLGTSLTAAQEAILQTQQLERTAEESAVIIGAAPIFWGLGHGVKQLLGKHSANISEEELEKMSQNVLAEMSVILNPNTYSKMNKSLGTPISENSPSWLDAAKDLQKGKKLNVNIKDGSRVKPSVIKVLPVERHPAANPIDEYHEFVTARTLKEIEDRGLGYGAVKTNWLLDAARRWLLPLPKVTEGSYSKTARKAGTGLVEVPGLLQRNVAGLTTPTAVQSFIKGHDGAYVDLVNTSNKEYINYRKTLTKKGTAEPYNRVTSPFKDKFNTPETYYSKQQWFDELSVRLLRGPQSWDDLPPEMIKALR